MTLVILENERIDKMESVISNNCNFKAEYTLGSVLGYIITLAVIITLGILGPAGIQTLTNYTGQKAELTSLKDAVIMYKVQSLTNMPPSSLDDLYKDPCISAANSKTGTPIPRLLEINERWSSNGVVDFWGNDYQYSVNKDGTGSIVCTSGIVNMSVDF